MNWERYIAESVWEPTGFSNMKTPTPKNNISKNTSSNIQGPKPTAPKMENGNFPLRLLSFNVFQPAWLSSLWGKIRRSPGYVDREVRAQELSNLIGSYDVCCLQEFNNETVSSKETPFKFVGIDPLPPGKIAQIARSYEHVSSTGGLVGAIRNDLPIIWEYVYKFKCVGDEESLNRSAAFYLLNMRNYWSGKYLLVCNVHFYGKDSHGDHIVREQQRGELYDEFCNLHKRLFPLGFKWENCGVIVCGCFNGAAETVDFSNAKNPKIDISIEYRKIINSLGKTHDILLETNPEASKIRTFDADKNKYVDRLRMNDTSRMDYIFSLDTIPSPVIGDKITDVFRYETIHTMPLMAESADVLTDVCISDHYPIIASIVPKNIEVYKPIKPVQNQQAKNKYY